MEKRYTYTDPKLLNRLVMNLTDDDSEVSVALAPDIEEFLAVAGRIHPKLDLVDPEIIRRVKELTQKPTKGKGINDENIRTMLTAAICDKHGIRPFWRLVFDYSLRPYNDPEIKYAGPRADWVDEEPHKSCVHPVHFARADKWYAINFREASGKMIACAKEAIAAFVQQGYVVIDIHADLQPRTRTVDHYDSRTTVKATLWASDGEIVMRGDLPADFDDFNPTKIPETAIPQLTEHRMRLEDLLG